MSLSTTTGTWLITGYTLSVLCVGLLLSKAIFGQLETSFIFKLKHGTTIVLQTVVLLFEWSRV